jgi:hypothetical protein
MKLSPADHETCMAGSIYKKAFSKKNFQQDFYQKCCTERGRGVCVCVCVCVREREREGGGGQASVRERESEGETDKKIV